MSKYDDLLFIKNNNLYCHLLWNKHKEKFLDTFQSDEIFPRLKEVFDRDQKFKMMSTYLWFYKNNPEAKGFVDKAIIPSQEVIVQYIVDHTDDRDCVLRFLSEFFPLFEEKKV